MPKFTAVAGLATALLAFSPASAAPTDFSGIVEAEIDRNLVYPSALQRRGVSGIATLRFFAGETGRAERIEIVRSSGHTTLDRAALRTMAAVDLPAGSPAGPHFAVLQFGTSSEPASARAAALDHANRQALAFRDAATRRLARAGRAANGVATID